MEWTFGALNCQHATKECFLTKRFLNITFIRECKNDSNTDLKLIKISIKGPRGVPEFHLICATKDLHALWLPGKNPCLG